MESSSDPSRQSEERTLDTQHQTNPLQDIIPALHSEDDTETTPALPTETERSFISRQSTLFCLPLLYPETWLYEVLSLVLATLAFVALIALLATCDRKPNPRWANDNITLNTVVSLTSTVFRISLMPPVAKCISQLGWNWFAESERPLHHVTRFDKASRGPIGSLQVLPVSALSRQVDESHKCA